MKNRIKDVLFFGGLFALIDQVVKIIISNKYSVYNSNDIESSFFSIKLTHNTGAAFSFFQGGRVVFIVVAILVVLLMSVYISNSEYVDGKKIFLYSLLLGGIIGNLVDRVIHGYVIDYISFTAFNYKFPVFNFADSCIVIAVIIAIVITVREDLWN